MHIQQHDTAVFTPNFLLLFLCQTLLLPILPVSACCCDGFPVRALQGQMSFSAVQLRRETEAPSHTHIIHYVLCCYAGSLQSTPILLAKTYQCDSCPFVSSGNDAPRYHDVRNEATRSLLKMHACLNLLQLNNEPKKIGEAETSAYIAHAEKDHASLPY